MEHGPAAVVRAPLAVEVVKAGHAPVGVVHVLEELGQFLELVPAAVDGDGGGGDHHAGSRQIRAAGKKRRW
jgi:hypothetical protein